MGGLVEKYPKETRDQKLQEEGLVRRVFSNNTEQTVDQTLNLDKSEVNGSRKRSRNRSTSQTQTFWRSFLELREAEAIKTREDRTEIPSDWGKRKKDSTKRHKF